MSAANKRIERLAQPKSLPPDYSEDKRSVYWIDRCPYEPGPEGTTLFALTPRQEYLCNPKRVHPLYKGDRSGPRWAVSMAARSGNCSDHVAILALPKSVPAGYQPERSVYTRVSDHALTASASQRLEQLAQPKPHKVWSTENVDFRDEGEFNEPINVLPAGALRSAASARVEQLAEPKATHAAYQAERPVMWPVSEQAKNSTASGRLQQLARPKDERLAKDEYDPYTVSLAAKSARASGRVSELSAPLPRKCRQKKVV